MFDMGGMGACGWEGKGREGKVVCRVLKNDSRIVGSLLLGLLRQIIRERWTKGKQRNKRRKPKVEI
jgi:hypothetical protein